MAEAKQAVGTPMSRVDGRLKVTGGARYAAEFQTKDVAYGVLVLSTVAKGQVTKIDTAAAEKAPGVLAVITHRNAGKLPPQPTRETRASTGDHVLQLLQDDRVLYSRQPIAIDLHRGHLDMSVATMPTTPDVAERVIAANERLS